MNRLEELRELLGHAIAQTVRVEALPVEWQTHELLHLCQKAVAKAQCLHNETEGVPEPKRGD